MRRVRRWWTLALLSGCGWAALEAGRCRADANDAECIIQGVDGDTVHVAACSDSAVGAGWHGVIVERARPGAGRSQEIASLTITTSDGRGIVGLLSNVGTGFRVGIGDVAKLHGPRRKAIDRPRPTAPRREDPPPVEPQEAPCDPMEETDFRAALRSWRWPDFERFLLVHPDGCFTQAAISSQLDVARSATRELECALRELEARDFDEARACIEHGRRLGVANLDAAWADLVRRLDAADPPASMDLARARLAGGDGASALTIVSKLALDDPMDDLARTWRAALQAVGGGADARRAEDDLRGLAARKGAAGTLAASVVEELQPSAWPEGSGRYPCAACGYPVLLDGVFCPHCLWPQRSMSLIRALSNSVRTTFEHEGSTLTSIVTTYAAPSGTRGAPGRPAVPLPRSWTLGHEAGMLRRVSSNVGLEPTSRWSGWRCDGEGASDARRAAWEMVLPHSPWRERGVTRLLLGEPLEPSHLVAPGHLAPFLPWERLSRFEVGHDADSHVEWLRDEESGCVYDVRFAAENLLSIVGRDNGYSRQLEYKDGRVVAERLVLPERGEFKLDYHWKPQLQKVEIRSSRDNFDVTMQ